MKTKFGIINFILIILVVVLLITPVSLAQGLLNPSGELKWESKYNRYSDSSTDLTLYGDYEFNFTGPLGSRKIGYYNFNLNHREYIKTGDYTKPIVTTYDFNTDLFPQSFFSLGLGAGKSDTKYDPDKENDITDDLVDTTTKHKSFSFSTPLPFGFRFGYSLNSNHQFDKQKTEVNKEESTERINLNKNMNFGEFVTSNFGTRYTESISEDLLENTKNTTTSKIFTVNNSLHTKPLSLADVDGKYSLREDDDDRTINYNLKTTWEPLTHLSFRTSQKKQIEEEKTGTGSFEQVGSILTSRMSFTADPYSILTFNGGVTKSEDKNYDLLNSRTLRGNFGVHLSYWEQAPLNLNINKSVSKGYSNTPANGVEEDSRYENTSISLNSNMHFGNFTINPSYSQNNSENVTDDEPNREVSNENLNIGLSYRKRLTNKLYFRGHTSFHSDMKTFEYNPNYDLTLRYNPIRSLQLKLDVNGYQRDKETNAKGVTQQAKDYRKWQGSLSYSQQRFRLQFDLTQENDFIIDEKITTVELDTTYYYRAVELNLETTWEQTNPQGGKTRDTLEVISSVIRRF